MKRGKINYIFRGSYRKIENGPHPYPTKNGSNGFRVWRVKTIGVLK